MADAIQAAFSAPQRNSGTMASFGQRLFAQFSTNEIYRRPKELEWLESLRQYKGIYDPTVKIDINASKVYPKITRSKINIVLSRLHEMLFPERDRNWELVPSKEPRIAKEIVKGIAMKLVKQPPIDPQTGQPVIDPQTNQPMRVVYPTYEELKLAIDKFVDECCSKMSDVVDDQLTEMDYAEETKKVLRSGLMYGTGVMKGPMITYREKRRWEPDLTGDYIESTEQEEVPFFENIRIWDWYPDMSTTEYTKTEGAFERHAMTKHDLRKLLERKDFYHDIITKYMHDHPGGDYVPKQWEVDLQIIEMEAGQGKTSGQAYSPSGTWDAHRSTVQQIGKKYEVLEFWGYVDGSDLEACGVNVKDVALEYAANIWVLGKLPIKATLFPGALDKYKLFYYEKDETSLYGEGLARVMRHSQLAIAGAARMVLDNAACVAGPQVEVNWSLLTPGTDISSFYARKIWYREGKGIDAQYPAVRPIEFSSHVTELLSIVDAFRQFGDEETTLPTWMIGQMLNNETAQATSGRMALITVSIKDVVKNFDSFTERILRDLYAWNMEFNSRTDIKGDYGIKARGVSSLVMKEVRMQALTQLTSTLTPAEWDYIPLRDFVLEKFKAHDLQINLLSEEEVSKLRQAREESKQNQLMYAQAEAEIAYKKAQTLSQITKAKKTNIEAVKHAEEPIETNPADDPRLAEADLSIKGSELRAKESEIVRKDEVHAQDMRHKEEQHKTSIATGAVQTAHDIAIKEKAATSNIASKEQIAKAKAKATGEQIKAKAKKEKAKKP